MRTYSLFDCLCLPFYSRDMAAGTAAVDFDANVVQMSPGLSNCLLAIAHDGVKDSWLSCPRLILPPTSNTFVLEDAVGIGATCRLL